MGPNGYESVKDGKWSDPRLPLPDCRQLLTEELQRVRLRKRPAKAAESEGAGDVERMATTDEHPR